MKGIRGNPPHSKFHRTFSQCRAMSVRRGMATQVGNSLWRKLASGNVLVIFLFFFGLKNANTLHIHELLLDHQQDDYQVNTKEARATSTTRTFVPRGSPHLVPFPNLRARSTSTWKRNNCSQIQTNSVDPLRKGLQYQEAAEARRLLIILCSLNGGERDREPQNYYPDVLYTSFKLERSICLHIVPQ